MIKEMSDLKRSVMTNMEKHFSILETNINFTVSGYADTENTHTQKSICKLKKKKKKDVKNPHLFRNVKTVILRIQLLRNRQFNS